ncbi:MAG: UvrD-helicase domain-containing protein [Ignavibacteria bacterium]|nr:UvrD-helicase domain-containing protein [Ignavibacteria bacterium]
MNHLPDLNEEQKAAVEYSYGPSMIIAGAGSGKTRVLTYKIAHLLSSGVRPYEILALTFTNKAAGEMKSRIMKLAGRDANDVWMGTFHSIFARILRAEAHNIGFSRNYTIYDDSDSEKLTESVMKDLGLSTDNPKPKAVISHIKILKNKLILHDQLTDGNNSNSFQKIVHKVYPEYQTRLLKNNAMDFDDLLINPILLFRSYPDILEKYQRRFRFILVDEYQDTNLAQYEITKMLASLHRNISVVGDDAQSIYRWRGAEIENIFSFQRDFPDYKLFKLERNYRSTKKILSVADSIISNNRRQIRKSLFTEREDGERVVLNETLTDRDEAHLISKTILKEISSRKLNFRDFLILYRTNAQSRVLEDTLRLNHIPYVLVGGVKFYERKEIKDVLAYLKVLVNPKDDEALIRVLKLQDGIGDGTVDKLRSAAKEHSSSVYDVLIRFINEREGKQKRTRIEAGLLNLASLFRKYHEVMAEFSPGELVRSLIDETGIIRQLRNEGTIEANERMNNIQELLSGITEYSDKTDNPSLEGFLQEVSLVTDIDTYEDSKNAVTLMTMHSSKGLEFPVVFIAGLEDGIFPLLNSPPTQEELEEERRLFYVAATRAKDRLYMSYALQRYRFGSFCYQIRSRFLDEIDLSDIEFIRPSTQRNKVVQEVGSSIRYEYFNDLTDTNDHIVDKQIVRKGAVVFHEKFGRGTVIEVSGKGERRKAQIYFDTIGLKSLVLKYANLSIK